MAIEIDVLPPVDTASWRHETAGEHADAVHDLIAARLAPEQQPEIAGKA